MTDICSCTVAVVSKDIQHDGSAPWAIALIGQLLVVGTVSSTQALLDGTVDIVLWNIVGLGLAESQLQTHVAGRICTAHTNGNGNLTADFGGNLATDGIISALFSLDICPFRMS